MKFHKSSVRIDIWILSLPLLLIACSTTPEVEIVESDEVETRETQRQEHIERGDRFYENGAYRKAWNQYYAANHGEGLRRTLPAAAKDREQVSILEDMVDRYESRIGEPSDSFRRTLNRTARDLMERGDLERALVLYRFTEDEEGLRDLLEEAEELQYSPSFQQRVRDALRNLGYVQ